jgi:hypothetical protein
LAAAENGFAGTPQWDSWHPMPVLDSLLGSLRGCLDRFPDKRRGMNTTYGMGDIGMAAFSVFFMQSPSLDRTATP